MYYTEGIGTKENSFQAAQVYCSNDITVKFFKYFSLQSFILIWNYPNFARHQILRKCFAQDTWEFPCFRKMILRCSQKRMTRQKVLKS